MMRSLAPISGLLCTASRPFGSAVYLQSAKRGLSTSATRREESEERRKARERAWYLSDPTPSSSTTSSAPSSARSSPAPIPRRHGSDPNHKRSPRFTTFDPHSTTSTSPFDLPIAPLPSGAPRHFKALHTFLTTHPEVIIPHSVRFLHAAKAAAGTHPDAVEVIQLGEGPRGRYDWVVIAQVSGRGKGVVARAERMLRLWLHDNPISALDTPRSRTSKLDLETDWALVPVGPGVDARTAVNLFTEEGLERWDLESLWSPSASNN